MPQNLLIALDLTQLIPTPKTETMLQQSVFGDDVNDDGLSYRTQYKAKHGRAPPFLLSYQSKLKERLNHVVTHVVFRVSIELQRIRVDVHCITIPCHVRVLHAMSNYVI